GSPGLLAGVRVRAGADGAIEQLGYGTDDWAALTEGLIGADPLVRDAAVVDAGLAAAVCAESGWHAWIAAAEGADTGAIGARLARDLPPSLRPAGYRFVDSLPVGPDGRVARAALAAALTPRAPAPVPPAPVPSRPTPAPSAGLVGLRARLAQAAARTPGLRHAQRDQVPPSAQAEYWNQGQSRVLRAVNQITVPERVLAGLSEQARA